MGYSSNYSEPLPNGRPIYATLKVIINNIPQCGIYNLLLKAKLLKVKTWEGIYCRKEEVFLRGHKLLNSHRNQSFRTISLQSETVPSALSSILSDLTYLPEGQVSTEFRYPIFLEVCSEAFYFSL